MTSQQENKAAFEKRRQAKAADKQKPSAPPQPEAQQGNEKGQSKFHFKSWHEMLQKRQSCWLVNQLIPEGGCGQLFGDSGAGKSFLAIDLAVAVAQGWMFFGKKAKRKPVRYCVLEGQGMFWKRIYAYEQAHKSEKETDHFWEPINGDIRFDETTLLSLINKEQIDDFIAELPEGSLVIIDTFACATSGLNENSPEVSQAIDQIKRIALSKKCTVMVVHHKGKSASDTSRGWSGLWAAWDFCLESRQNGKQHILWISKEKDSEDNYGLPYSLVQVKLKETDETGKEHFILDEDGKPETSCIVKFDGGQLCATKRNKISPGLQRALDTLKQALEAAQSKEVSYEQWRPFFMEKATGSDERSKSAQFSNARKKLVEKGLINVRNDFYSIVEDAEKPHE